MNFTRYFRDSSAMLEKLTADITEEHAGKFLNDRVNNIKWHKGHIALTRVYFLERWNTDLNPQRFFGQSERKLFDRGGTPPRNPDEYPTLERLRGVIRQVDEAWSVQLETFTEVELQRPHSRTSDESLQDLLVFLLTHEAYHCGQVGLVRAGIGYPGVFG